MKKIFTILIYFFTASFVLKAQESEKNIKAGNYLYKKQQFEKASEEYKKIPEWDSTFAIAQFNLGNSLYKSGKKDEANKTFNQLLKKEKDTIQSSKLNYNEGVILGSQQKLEESIEAYKKALLQNPDDKDARENLQKALLELKRKNPPPKKEDQKKKQEQKPKMNRKEASQKLKDLEQKEKKVQQKMQNQKTSSNSQKKDW
jgi:tetratricopeptide (TPR) repeat protein